jgi:CheY-like chemotaxis protein
MGGNIRVESQEGIGSTFYVRIPFLTNDKLCEQSDLPRVDSRPIWEGGKMSVLLVEDNVGNQKLFADILTAQGLQVDTALNGVEALVKLSQTDFNIVLMDVQMPVMDGIQAVRRLREIEAEQGGHVPVIALTAHAMHGYKDQILLQGFDGYLSKPVKIHALLNEVKRCLEG